MAVAERPRLKPLREQRGWTQQEVAEQLARLAWLRNREHVGVNADMVAKWERGEKRPSPRYRELLCLLFETDGQALGIGGSAPPLPARGDPEDASLIASLSGAASLLDQLGPAGAILQPRLFGVWKDELMQRRALLKLIGLATATGFGSADSVDPARSGQKPTPETARDLDRLAGRYQALYHSTAPAVLMTPVAAHLQTLRDLLRDAGAPTLRRRLLANQARVATLAGRLAFFDLRDPLTARGYYALALESAQEAGDALQAAGALAHMAFIPAEDRGFSAALDYLGAAASHAAKRPEPRVESWLCAIESEFHANAGGDDAALRAIDRAREALAAPGLEADLPWFDYYDATRLSGFAGYALLRAGKHEQARAALDDALARLPKSAVKQRAVFHADAAMVEVSRGDVEQACRIAGDAAEELGRAGYAVGFSRLAGLRAALEPWAASGPVRALDEQLAALR